MFALLQVIPQHCVIAIILVCCCVTSSLALSDHLLLLKKLKLAKSIWPKAALIPKLWVGKAFAKGLLLKLILSGLWTARLARHQNSNQGYRQEHLFIDGQLPTRSYDYGFGDYSTFDGYEVCDDFGVNYY